MVGRLDDWLKVLVEKNNLSDRSWLPGVGWCGCIQERHTRCSVERGYRLRLLSAAFRNHMHWSELIGGDVVISPPYSWQVRFNASDVEVCPRIDEPVRARVVEELEKKFPDFHRAYTEIRSERRRI